MDWQCSVIIKKAKKESNDFRSDFAANDVSALNPHQKCERCVFLMTSLRNKTYVKKKINFLHANPESINSFVLKKRMKKCFKVRNIRLTMRCYHKIKNKKEADDFQSRYKTLERP